MAADNDRDALQAEAEYIRQRLSEQREEFRALVKQLGFEVTAENIGQVLDAVLLALRDSGNSALADKYRLAFERWKSAAGQLQHAVNTEAPTEELDMASHELADAGEQFERVQAEADEQRRLFMWANPIP
jgi:uncharacterized protein YukE